MEEIQIYKKVGDIFLVINTGAWFRWQKSMNNSTTLLVSFQESKRKSTVYEMYIGGKNLGYFQLEMWWILVGPLDDIQLLIYPYTFTYQMLWRSLVVLIEIWNSNTKGQEIPVWKFWVFFYHQ